MSTLSSPRTRSVTALLWLAGVLLGSQPERHENIYFIWGRKGGTCAGTGMAGPWLPLKMLLLPLAMHCLEELSAGQLVGLRV